MAERTIFRNAPITEALLDIQVTLPKDIDLSKLESFQDAIKNRYPMKRERTSWQSKIKFDPEKGPEPLPSSGGVDGFLFHSADGKQIVQARLDGFTFNKLKPYDKWEALRDEAQKLWAHYIEIANPEQVTRVALRYINRIEIPLPLKDLKDYILTVPEIAAGFPQGLRNFFMRLEIPILSIDSLAIVTLTMEPPAETKTLPLIFDIDVIYNSTALDPSSSHVWSKLEDLHNLKNDIFFKSITEKTERLFQ